MDRYKTMVEVVRSAAFDQPVGVDAIANWLAGWKNCTYLRRDDFHRDVTKMIRTEGLLYDGLDVELFDKMEHLEPESGDVNPVSLPLLNLGDSGEAIPNENNQEYHCGTVDAVNWSFSEECWIYRLCGDEGWHIEPTIRKCRTKRSC